MTTATLLKHAQAQTIGKAPVVVLPLKIWEIIEDQLEEAEIVRSRFLHRRIAKARAERKLYSASQARRILKI